jgi:hypothetical protein
MAVFGQDTFAYLTERPGNGSTDKHSTQQAPSELRVCAYGPSGRQLTDRVTDRIRDWDGDRQSIGRLWIEVHRAGTGGKPEDLMIIDKRQTRVTIRTARRVSPHNGDGHG